MSGKCYLKIARTCVALATLFLVGCGEEPDTGTAASADVEAALETATQLSRDGDHQAALRELESIRESHPDNPDVFAALAGAYRRSGDHAMASLFYDAVLKQRPRDTDILREAAETAIADKSPQRAIDLYARYLEEAPGDSAIRRERARLLAEQGDYGAAHAEIERVLEAMSVPPTSADLILAGELALRAGKFDAAENAFSEAIPATTVAERDLLRKGHLGRLEAAVRREDWPTAWEHYQNTEALLPGVIASSQLATVVERLEDWQAEQAANTAAGEGVAGDTGRSGAPADAPEADGDAEAANEAVTALADAQDDASGDAEALDTAEPGSQAASASSRDPGVIFLNGQLYDADLRRLQEARRRQQQRLGQQQGGSSTSPGNSGQPQSLTEQLNAGARAYQDEDYATAEAHYLDALSTQPQSAKAAYGLSRTYFEMERYDTAELFAAEAVRLERLQATEQQRPESSRYTIHHLRTLQQAQTSERFMVELIRARRRFPESPSIALALGEAYERIQRNPAQALAAYEAFLRLAPGHDRAPSVRRKVQVLQR